jgi:hypothetical protein
MSKSEIHSAPEPDWKDRAHALVRAGLGSIPLVGAAANQLFQLVITPSLEKRRVEWMNSVAEALKELESRRQVRIEDLASNEPFIDTVLHASQAALRNSQQEKREALRNAVLNSALPCPPDESIQQMFIEWIDSLTVWHLRILRVLDNPKRWFQEAGREVPEYASAGILFDLLVKAYPELQSQRILCDQIGRDLYGRGLSGTDNFHAMTSGSGMYSQRTTEMGQAFLKFTLPPAAIAEATT